jgi:vacuolar-type H+-ATPase subunit I/STV1
VKIRQQFVSNSSSSSFVIAFKKQDDKPCPTCGFSPPNILDFLDSSDENVFRELEELEQNLQQEIQRDEEDLRKMQTKHPDSPAFPDSTYYTVKEVSEEINKTLAENRELLSKIHTYANSEYIVGELELDYHNDAANRVFKELCSNKKIVVLKRED